MGGAQAIAALAYGTETVAPVDVIAGPGNAYVQEAKRQVLGLVGIDGSPGPSELIVVAGHDADPEWIALDLCAQAEHGDESLLVARRGRGACPRRGRGGGRRGGRRSRPSVSDAPLALVQVPDAEAAIELANAFAPEHLELVEEDAGAARRPGAHRRLRLRRPRRRRPPSATTPPGSNHVLPTGGAGRFAGPLGPATFRRRISRWRFRPTAAREARPARRRDRPRRGLPGPRRVGDD